MTSTDSVEGRLSLMAERLRLTWMRDHMADMLQTASDANMTPRETLEYFFTREIERREENRVRLGMMGAHFPRVCTFDEFDMAAQPSLDPGLIRELRTLEWIAKGRNLLLQGPPGVGKTHIAIALGREAVIAGKSVLFLSATKLVKNLQDAKDEDSLEEKIAAYCKPKLLIIDELGYLPFGPAAAHMLFLLVSKRYENKSIVITTNRPIGEWGLVLGDSTAAAAILDRFIHHCTVLTIQGQSYRLRSFKTAKILGENNDPIPIKPTE